MTGSNPEHSASAATISEDVQPTSNKTGGQQTDKWLASIYLCAAATLLAFIDPVTIQFEPRPVESLVAAGVGSLLVLFATARRMRVLLYAGVAFLFALILVCVITQPSALNVPVVSIWPLRMLLVMLVGFPWALLMHPGPLLRRTLLGVAGPTVIAVLLWGGPATVAHTLGARVPVAARNFAPFWMAVGGQGPLYATDARGGMVWVFDPSGTPRGTLRPAYAPAIPTPGPGILPTGIDEEIGLAGMGVVPTRTPRPGMEGMGLNPSYFEFCGLASDASDNLYTIDIIGSDGYKLLRFDREGNITARWPLAKDYAPSDYCVTSDRDHLYLSSSNHKTYVLDYEGNFQKEIDLGFQPYGVARAGDGRLIVVAPNMLAHVDVASSEVTTVTLKPTTGVLMMPVQPLPNGDVLVTNHITSEIVRVRGDTGEIVGTIGGPGSAPGQFAEIGSIAVDQAGHVFVSDWRHRVIQKFSASGKLEAVWWANLSVAVPGLPGDPDADLEQSP